jgi:hypothetical protein
MISLKDRDEGSNDAVEKWTLSLVSIRPVLSSPVAISRMLHSLGTAGREQFDPTSQKLASGRRGEGLLEASIVLSKHLYTILGENVEHAYPQDELPDILKSIGEKYGCLKTILWAALRSLPSDERMSDGS